MTKKFYLLLIFSFAINFICLAQNQNKPDSLKTDSLQKANQVTTTTTQTASKQKRDTRPLKERIFFDISTSFWVNSTSTFFQFFPSIGYRFPRIISVGAGPVYIYNRDRIHHVDLNGWGGSIYSTAHFTRWFYAYTEYQGINNQYVSAYDQLTKNVTKDKQYVSSWFLSLGINIRLGKRHGINMQALYDVLYDKETSPYYSAWTYRVGFGF
jgi:hypothetical protein